MRPYIYLRGLRQAEHTVFAVANGQKTYRDPLTNREQAYSSGQQVKRAILDTMADELGELRAPITFVKELGKSGLKDREPWSPCDPTYADQLIGGWMRAQARTGDKEGGRTIRRRSPLSISAMRPLHPYLASVSKEPVVTFDRRDQPELHRVVVFDEQGREVPNDVLRQWLEDHNQSLRRMNFLPEQARAYGLFVYDVAIDLRRLFAVSLAEHDAELEPDTIERLRDEGWREVSGRLVAPAERREAIARALAYALVNWAIGSNQSRTYSPLHMLAVALSDRANLLGAAIRAELPGGGVRDTDVRVVLEPVEGTELFVTPVARAVVPGVDTDANALVRAEKALLERLLAFDYEAPLPAHAT